MQPKERKSQLPSLCSCLWLKHNKWMEKAQVGERQGTGSVPDRECQLGCQGDIEKMVTAVSKSMAEGRQKGEGHGKITLGRNYWKLLIRYRQNLSMAIPRSRSFDQTDKKWPFMNGVFKTLQ